MDADRIIVALDAADRRRVDELCEALAGKARILKIGLQLFIAEGPAVVAAVREAGFDVFLDLKLHDIPHQVGLACAEIARMGVAMFTVHAGGGRQMLVAAAEATANAAAEQGAERPKILGVTVLTSLEGDDLAALGVVRNVVEQVGALAGLALESGLDGVVASPLEVSELRRRFGQDFIVVTPGIRPVDAGRDDQRRTMTAGEAAAAGATYLVVGRAVTTARDPGSAFAAIARDL